MMKKNLKQGLRVTSKFILGGLIIMSSMVLLKNGNDFLTFGIPVIVSFILGGLAMFLSLFKELKILARENMSLKRKLKRAQKELVELNTTLENVPVSTLIDFNEASKNRTA